MLRLAVPALVRVLARAIGKLSRRHEIAFVVAAIVIGWIGCIEDPFADDGIESYREILARAIDAPKPARSHETRKPEGTQCFVTFSSFKRSAKDAGRKAPSNHHWHHIVEQHDANKARFGGRLQCTDNLIAIPYKIHQQITGFYNSKQDWTGEQRVRDVIKLRSWSRQYEFGLQVLRERGFDP